MGADDNEKPMFRVYGEYVSESTNNTFVIFGTPTGKRLLSKSDKPLFEQSKNNPGMTFYRGHTPSDVHCLYICALLDQGFISVPAGADDKAFLTQISDDVTDAEAAGKFNIEDYTYSLIKKYPPRQK